MAKKNQYHVIPHKDGWAVKVEGHKRNSSVHPTQKEAISDGQKHAHSSEGSLVIHGKDGKVRATKQYGRSSTNAKMIRKVLSAGLVDSKRKQEIRNAVKTAMREMNGSSANK